VCDQLADSYTDSRPRAFDESGDHRIGAHNALSTVDELREAATLLDVAEGRLSTAMSAVNRTSWHVFPAQTRRLWIGVVFLDGSQTDRVLDLIQREGPSAGIEYLKQCHYGGG
jgi:hypothetical protein